MSINNISQDFDATKYCVININILDDECTCTCI